MKTITEFYSEVGVIVDDRNVLFKDGRVIPYKYFKYIQFLFRKKYVNMWSRNTIE